MDLDLVCIKVYYGLRFSDNQKTVEKDDFIKEM